MQEIPANIKEEINVVFVKNIDEVIKIALIRPTIPIESAQGKKMGKTESGTVWLDGDMLKPYDYWQYFRNIDDQDIGRFLRFFTDLPIDEIKKLESSVRNPVHAVLFLIFTFVSSTVLFILLPIH